MHIKETFADKAAEGKSKVLEFGVYILETLGAVGLPAEQVAAALLSFRPAARSGDAAGAAPASASKADARRKKKRHKRAKPSGAAGAGSAGSSSKNRADSAANSSSNNCSLSGSNGNGTSINGASSSSTTTNNNNSNNNNRRSSAADCRARHPQKNNDFFHRALRFVIEARSSSPQQVISRILFYLADALGESLDRPSKRDLERAVGAFVEEAHCHRGNRVKLERIPQPLCRAVTGVVLSYQERDDLALPPSTLNRIRRGMHFDIPIRPFDATVQLLPPPSSRGHRFGDQLRLTDAAGAPLCDRDAGDENPDVLDDYGYGPHDPYFAGGDGGGDEHDVEECSCPSPDTAAGTSRRRTSRVAWRHGAGSRDSAATLADDPHMDYYYDEHEQEERDKLLRRDLEEQDYIVRRMADNNRADCVVPCTPSSFPPTPESRTQLLGDYSEFTENVLYRARDELRGEQEDDDRPRMAIFNPDDAHPKVLLCCGGHCATLEQRRRSRSALEAQPTSQRIYRSVRAALALQQGRVTYLEFCPVWSGPGAEPNLEQPLHLCVGLSTKAMPLRNTVPGFASKTIGLDSSGILLFCGRRTRTIGFTYGSVISLCVRTLASHLEVSFFVDGEPVSCDAQDLGLDAPADPDGAPFKAAVCTFPLTYDEVAATPGAANPVLYYPTVSLKSNNVKVFGHFSAADMLHAESETHFWGRIAEALRHEPLFALDGTRLFAPRAPTPATRHPPPAGTAPAPSPPSTPKAGL